MKQKILDDPVELDSLYLKQIPDEIHIDKCLNMYDVSDNRLTSLKNCPYFVKGNFLCSYNRLTSLEYGPQEVQGNYIATNNQLTSLNGIATKIFRSLKLSHNKITSLDGIPELRSGASLEIEDNNISNLSGYGFEKIQFHDFTIVYNKITTLLGGPRVVVGDYDLSGNPIKNFVGGPTVVGNNFYCHNLKNVESFEGWPKVINGNVFITEDDANRLFGEKISRTSIRDRIRSYSKVLNGRVWLSGT